MTPQEAVDAVVLGENLKTINHADLWCEILGPGLNILINHTGVGVAYSWPPAITKEEAKLNSWLEQCELSTLECTRIMREVTQRLAHG